jgi:hypothetical protein
MSERRTALDAFITRKAEIDTMLAREGVPHRRLASAC